MSDPSTVLRSAQGTGLPSWAACQEKADGGEVMTALEIFIYNYEPLYADDVARFRRMLADVVKALE